MSNVPESVRLLTESILKSSRSQLATLSQNVLKDYEGHLEQAVSQNGIERVKQCEDELLKQSNDTNEKLKREENAAEGDVAKLQVRLRAIEDTKIIQDKINIILALDLRMETSQIKLHAGPAISTAQAMQTLNSTMSQILQNLVQKPGIKPISETKAFQQLKMSNGDRKDFKEWNEKLIAALCQTHTKMKPIVQKLIIHTKRQRRAPK